MRWTSSPSAHRPPSERLVRLVLIAVACGPVAACGGGAGAYCSTDGDCAPGLVCARAVCLPAGFPDAYPGEADVAEVDAASDEGDSEAGPDAGGDEAGGDAEEDEATDAPDETPEPAMVSLEPGEIADVDDPSAPFGVEGGVGEEYALIVWENGLSILVPPWNIAIEVENGRKSRPPASRRPAAPAIPAPGCVLPGLLDRFAPRLPRFGPRVMADPDPGDTATFLVIDAARTGVEEITARLMSVGAVVEIWYDETNGFADPGEAFRTAVIDWFERVVLPRERWLFAHESDVNGDGRIAVLISPTVGEIGASGYVSPTDLVDSPMGNHREIIYLNPPPDWYGAEWRILYASGVLAHELQHLIRAGAIGADPPEAIYFNEGMSHLAADLAGFGFDNLGMLDSFLGDYSAYSIPGGIDSGRSTASSDYGTDAVLRSGSYLLLRYLLDRLGGVGVEAGGALRDDGGLSFLRGQFLGEAYGIAYIEQTTGAFHSELVPDWLTAMLLDGRTGVDGEPLSDSPRYRLGEPAGDPLTGAQRGVALNEENSYLDIGSVMLPNVSTVDLRDYDGRIASGAFELLEVRPVAAGPVVVRIAAPAGADIGARWIRLR